MSFDDKRLGIIVLDSVVGEYVGRINWCGFRAELRLGADDAPTARRSLRVALRLLDAADEWKKRIEDFAVAKLLDLKNESWREENEPKVTGREFRKLLTLRTMSTRGDGRFEFWHDDGGLFYGHSIVVAGDLKKGPTDAEIHG
jgi:hypothetical protein